MKEDFLDAIFLLAKIPVKSKRKILNGYTGNVPAYAEYSIANPWWLVETSFGLIEIGWRKRVISINWSSTPYRGKVTDDNVTQFDDVIVHAWGYPKAIEYLESLALKVEQWAWQQKNLEVQS